jgi:hypothetical protein
MPMFTRSCVVLLLISASACGGSNSVATSSSPAPTVVPATPPSVPHPISTFHLAGVSTDDDGNLVADAKVTIQPVFYQATPCTAVVKALRDQA